jgi:hypothetical protein
LKASGAWLFLQHEARRGATKSIDRIETMVVMQQRREAKMCRLDPQISRREGRNAETSNQAR